MTTPAPLIASREALAEVHAAHRMGEWREIPGHAPERYGKFCTCGTILNANDVDGSLALHVADVMLAICVQTPAEFVAALGTHNDAPVTAENLNYAATHEALCRPWIFDVLTGLAAALSTRTPS